MVQLGTIQSGGMLLETGIIFPYLYHLSLAIDDGRGVCALCEVVGVMFGRVSASAL